MTRPVPRLVQVPAQILLDLKKNRSETECLCSFSVLLHILFTYIGCTRYHACRFISIHMCTPLWVCVLMMIFKLLLLLLLYSARKMHLRENAIYMKCYYVVLLPRP